MPPKFIKRNKIFVAGKGVYDSSTHLYTVKANLSNGLAQVQARLLFDTGASYTGINPNFVDQLNLKSIGTSNITFGGGDKSSEIYLLQRLIIRDSSDAGLVIYVENQPVIALPTIFFKSQPHLSGVLGGSFLRHVEFYMGGGRISLYQEQK